MEEIKLNIGQNRNNSYTKINTEDDNELYDFNYEKELPVTDMNAHSQNRIRSPNQQQNFCYKKLGTHSVSLEINLGILKF